MAHSASLMIVILARTMPVGIGAFHTNPEAEACGPSQICWGRVPMSWHENYYEACDPQTDNFSFNFTDYTAFMQESGTPVHQCFGLACWFSVVAALRVAQTIFIFSVSFFLPPSFAIAPIQQWRSTRKDLDEMISKELQFSSSLSEGYEEFFDSDLSKDARVAALETFKDFLRKEDEATKMEKEIPFESVQRAIKSMSGLSRIQRKFLFEVAVSQFYDPKDPVRIFGLTLADVHPLSDSFSEDTAQMWIGERLKQPAVKASVPMPWSQRVQIGLFWATAVTLLFAMASMFFLSRASPWRLVHQNRWALLLRATMLLPTMSVLLRTTLWIVQSQNMTGSLGRGSRVGPFDRVRSAACGVVAAVLLLGASPQLVPALPLVLSLGCVWATRRASIPPRGGASQEEDLAPESPLIQDVEMALRSSPRRPDSRFSCSHWLIITVGVCLSTLLFGYLKLTAEEILADTFLCMHSKVDVMTVSLDPESLTGFVITLICVVFVFCVVLGVLVLLRGSDVIDNIVPASKFYDLWIHLSDVGEAPWIGPSTTREDEGSLTTREAWQRMEQAGRKLKKERAAAREKAFYQYWMFPEHVERAPFSLRSSRKFMLAALAKDGQNGDALRSAAEELKRDRDVVLAAVAQRGNALQFAAEELQGDRGVVLAAVARNGLALTFAAEEFKRDRDVVLAAVAQNAYVLQYAAEEFKRDRDVVLAAVAQNGDAALQFAAEELRRDRELVLAAVAENGYALQHAAWSLRRDRDVVLAAVAKRGNALQFAAEEPQRDRDVVLAAVTQAGGALQYASEELRRDRDVVLAAVAQNKDALRFAHLDLLRDPDFGAAAAADLPPAESPS